MKTLYGKDSKGELRVWSVYAEADQVVVRHGKLNGKITEKRYTAEGKNQGRSNETSPSEQAILEAEAKYVKQLKSGYFTDKDEALGFEKFTPMKAHNYNEHSHKITYPCIIQPKLNGQRLMIDKNGQAWSKQGEPLELPKHWIGVKEYAISCGGLDGEVYAGLESDGGLSLQKIISAFRKENEDTIKLQYWVYDIPKKEPQNIRLTNIDSTSTPSVVLSRGFVVLSEETATRLYNSFIEQGYEGAIYRNLEGVYEFGKRSYNLIKRKPRQTMEAKVNAVEKDRNGWGVLNCKTIDTQIPFKCQMRVDAAEKNYRLYENALELLGSTIETEYEELSDAGVPTKPTGVGIRKVDKFGRPVV